MHAHCHITCGSIAKECKDPDEIIFMEMYFYDSLLLVAVI